MSDYLIHRRLALNPGHVPTGKTRHYLGTPDNRVELPPPKQLMIVQIPPDLEGFYLLYLDDKGNELTDTYHDSLEQAQAQAVWEFGVDPDEWEAG
jgi:hypothetical protein